MFEQILDLDRSSDGVTLIHFLETPKNQKLITRFLKGLVLKKPKKTLSEIISDAPDRRCL